MERETYIGLGVAAAVLVFLLFQKPDDAPTTAPQLPEKQEFKAIYGTPTLNGDASDEVWQQATWQPLDQVWLGQKNTPEDFSGQYKLAWDENFLYILAEITDDTLVDTHPDGLDHYWDDDCLEIFVDEDASGGDHQYSYNAFAYHVALNGNVVDIKPNKDFAYFNDHCTSRRKTLGKRTIWEVAVRIFDENIRSDSSENIPKMLNAGKKMGFMLAYCDNDHSPERENFVGNTPILGEDKNRGWIDASVFGKLQLVENQEHGH